MKRQVALFPKSSDFDFRTLFDDNISESNLRKYFDDDLFHFISDITHSDSSLHGKRTSDIHTSDKTIREYGSTLYVGMTRGKTGMLLAGTTG